MASEPELATESMTEELGPVARRFVLHWGEMGWRWGVNRTVAQIHALLFLLGRPMHAEEIAGILRVARSNVSNSLHELQNWNLVRIVHLVADRRDHYETAHDPWDLLRTIVRGRKAREFDPTLVMLRGCVSDPGLSALDEAAQKRMKETLGLMEALSTWTDQMLNVETSGLKRFVKLGAKVQTLLQGRKKE